MTHRATCSLLLVLAAGAVAVLLALHDGTASERAAWLGVLIAVIATSAAARGRRRPETRPEVTARR